MSRYSKVSIAAAILCLMGGNAQAQEHIVRGPDVLNRPEVRAVHDSLFDSVVRPARLKGKTMIEVLVGADGSADFPRVLESSGSLLLDSLAIAVVKRMKFGIPMGLDEHMHAISVRMPIIFGTP